MKTIFKLAGVILIILCQSACRTHKLLNRQEDRSAAFEATDTHTREQQKKFYSMQSSIIDSSGQLYQVTIFPADTFQFSLQQGFKGKATKVEVKGSASHLKMVNDSATFSANNDSETRGTLIRKQETERLAKSKSVENKWLNWLPLCLAIAAMVMIVMIFLRFRKRISNALT